MAVNQELSIERLYLKPLDEILSRDLTLLMERKVPHRDGVVRKGDITLTLDSGVVKNCVFLCLPSIKNADAKIGPETLLNFERVIRYLVDNKLVAHGCLGPPFTLPLVGNREIFLWYVFSDYSREELNAKIGVSCFVEEGGMYSGKWPDLRTV